MAWRWGTGVDCGNLPCVERHFHSPLDAHGDANATIALKMVHSQLQRAFLSCVFVPFLTADSMAISVDLIVGEGAYCGQATGWYYASAQGGTEPYQYDWYVMNGGTPIPFCMDCGYNLNNISEFTTYKVVVTDALSATAEDTELMPGFIATMFWDAGNYPYLAGASPVVYYLVSGEGPQGVMHDSQVTPGIAQGSAGNGYRTNSLPPGTSSCTITAWATYPAAATVCPPQDYVLSIGPPTVLPTVTPLQVQPSCSNGTTGRIEFALTNGSIPNGIHVRLKNAGGAIAGFQSFIHSDMPTATGTFTSLAPGNYHLLVTGVPPNAPVNFGIPGFNYTCRDSVAVMVPSTGAACGQAQGSVFIDSNLNCTKQTSEPGIPGVVLKVLPGPYFVNTSSTGDYSLQLPAGNYTINEEHAQIGQNCSAPPIPFTVPAVAYPPVTVNVPCTSLVAMDADISITSGPARPGFALQYALLTRNLTPAPSGNITVTVQLDPALSFTSAVPAPSSVVGNTLVWNQAALGPFESRSINIVTQVPNDVGLLGTALGTTATLATTVTDGALGNNQAVCVTTVTGSFDPNDKVALTSSGSRTQYDPAQDGWIDYTLRFQNTGTDTAFTVVITDTLPTNLDPATLVIGATSHAFTWTLRGARTLRFQFVNIRLPHAAVNEPGSHGFVSFRIRPVLPLAAGAQISNRANIFFDFNAPVITDPSVLTVPTPPVLLSPRAYLGGVYAAGSPPMSDALRTQGRLPLLEPYSALGYAHTGTGGGEVVQPSTLLVTGNNAIVDWVLVELRQASGAGAVVASRSALLQRDGDVVAPNGTSPLAFHVPSGGSYRIALRHRNHLGVMSASPITITTTTSTLNFTAPATATFGTNAQNNMSGVMVLWPGNVNFDGVVKYVGPNNDRDPILQAIGGSVPTNTVSNVYSGRDVNLDGVIRYVGANNDRDVILQTVGGSVPTATRVQQLP